MVELFLPSILYLFLLGTVKPLYMLIFDWNDKTIFICLFLIGIVKPLYMPIFNWNGKTAFKITFNSYLL